MAAGFKPFGYDSIYTTLLRFYRKFSIGNDVNYRHSFFLQKASPCGGVTGRSKYNLKILFYQNIHDFLNVWIKQWYIYGKRMISCLLTLLNMLT
ncbi:hypothetical protein D3C85_1259260 [compost metagenome]